MKLKIIIEIHSFHCSDDNRDEEYPVLRTQQIYMQLLLFHEMTNNQRESIEDCTKTFHGM